MQLIEGINITTFWGLTSNIKQQSNKWMTICDWQGEVKTFSVKGNGKQKTCWLTTRVGLTIWLTKSKTDDENRTSMIARNPCEDGLNYKQRRYTAVSDMKLWCRSDWVSTRRSWLMLSLGQTRYQAQGCEPFGGRGDWMSQWATMDKNVHESFIYV